jgi:hypothetical protein
MVIRFLLPKFIRSFVGFSLVVIVIGCGKKTETTQTTSLERQTGPVITDLEQYLEKQELTCETGEVCPNYIAKLAVVSGNRVKFCTGFLVGPETLATSSSCLTSLLRLNNQDCSKDVHIYFPSSFNRKSERVGCKKVLEASQIEVKEDVVLWRDDVSFLELDQTMRFRRQLSFLREGMSNHKNFIVWGVEQIDDFNAFIRRQSCEAVHNSWVNPLVTKDTSPGMLMSDCIFKNGYTGGPIMDSRGKVRGSISQPMSSKIRDYLQSTGLLLRPLKEMLHATNFSCAKTHLDSEVADERECTKDLNYSVLDKIRNDMLAPDLLFNEFKTKFEQKISDASKYFNFGVKLLVNGEMRKLQIFPKCFKNINNWIFELNTTRSAYSYEMKVPNTIFQRSMDPYGRIRSSEATDGEKGYFIQFSPKSLRAGNSSTVFMWNSEFNQTYPSVTDACK